MEFHNDIVPHYHQRPYFGAFQHNDEFYDDFPPARGQHVNRVSANCSPTQPAMERFLQEHDRTLFTARLHGPQPPCPSLELETAAYHDYNIHSGYSHRYPSPTDSGPSSAYMSSSYSDRQSTPWSSPDPSVFVRSPGATYVEHSGYRFFHHSPEEFKGGMSGPCVTLHDVQGYADAQPESYHFEDESSFYQYPMAQEVVPMEQEAEPESEHPNHGTPNAIVNGHGSIHRDGSSPELPNIRRRRPQTTRAVTSPTKVSKRPASRRSSSSSKTNGHKNHSYCASASNKAFPCPFAIYNCDATFSAKNEWKRHVNTQHMQIAYWRCDLCDQTERKPNDFNRKDLFIQHVRRMHPFEVEKPTKPKNSSSRPSKNDPEEKKLNDIANRCHQAIREPPEDCSCIICGHQFTGPGAWDERLEHIGKHWEKEKKDNNEPEDSKRWHEDQALHHFLRHENIIAPHGKTWVLA